MNYQYEQTCENEEKIGNAIEGIAIFSCFVVSCLAIAIIIFALIV